MNINELAAIAGVSRTTVSRVLHGGYVSAEARARVEQAFKDTGYVPNAQAQAFRMQRTNVIGIVVPSLDSVAILTIAERLMDTAEEQGYHCAIRRYRSSSEKLLHQIRQLHNHVVDGLYAFLTAEDQDVTQEIAGLSIPAVTIAPFAIDGVDGIIYDDANAFAELARIAIDRGCRSIGTLFPPNHPSVMERRQKAVFDAMEQKGLSIRKEWQLSPDVGNANHHEYGKLIGHGVSVWKERPDALITASDKIAMEVIQQLQMTGVHVPMDVCVSGAGNTEVGRLLRPSLTTTCINLDEISVSAARMMHRRLSGGEYPAEHLTVKAAVLRGESL